MSNFTYELPNEVMFFQAILSVLKNDMNYSANNAYDIFKDAVNKMVDESCDDATEKQLYDMALAQEGVLGIDLLRTRMFGNKIYVDLEIRADGNKTLHETHEIAEQLHDKIERGFPKVKHIMIHVNPNEQ